MTAITLRDYQQEAIDALHASWARGTRRAAVVLPTGMGKTVAFAHLAQEEAGRSLILVHRDELVRQAVGKLRSVVTDRRIGVVKAEQDDWDADIIVASVQTLRGRRLHRFSPDAFALIIVDECHHAVADSWSNILEHFAAPRVAGFTATLERGDQRGLGGVWQEVAYTRDIPYGIAHGYLAQPRGIRVAVGDLDLDAASSRGGDYTDTSLGEALTDSSAAKVTAETYLEHAVSTDGARSGVLFAPTVDTAGMFAEAFTGAGITTEVITGNIPVTERQDIYRRHREGETSVLASCMVLTEGWDAPWTSCAVIARPTRSRPLYVQMAGRVLRPWPGKSDALILDVAGVSTRHDLLSVADLAEDDTHEASVADGQAPDLMAIGSDQTRRELTDADQVTVTEVDLFGRSVSAWSRTDGGTWFVPTRAGYVFLRPDGEDWMIGKTADQYRMKGSASDRTGVGGTPAGQSWGWFARVPDLGYAMATAEGVALALDPSIASRRASWRSRPASPAQRELAGRLGATLAPSARASEVSEAISRHYASRLLDPRRSR